MDALWLTHGQLVAPQGIVDGAIGLKGGRIAAIRLRAPRGARAISVRGCYVAPGFIDLHIWGDPAVVSRESIRHGTTAFLTTVGPAAPEALVEKLRATFDVPRSALHGAACLGIHLEGPFLNPARRGALASRAMRRPTLRELGRLVREARGRLRLLTMAPELPGALAAIRWCARRGIAVSLGHSDADARVASQAVESGARAVTHLFNGMRPFHHRDPALAGVALADPSLTAMVIADGIHLSGTALRLLVRAKGAQGVALVTDSVRAQRHAGGLRWRGGAFYTRDGTLAGSDLTMMQAIRNVVRLGGASLAEAVQMATQTPARLLRFSRTHGILVVGARADLVVFDRTFRVLMTVVDGQVVYRRQDR